MLAHVTHTGTRDITGRMDDLTPDHSRRGKESPPVKWDMEGGFMAGKRYTEEQIIAVLNEAEAGAKTGELRGRQSADLVV